ncbi:MAG: rhodanese-like domain-containing protein [Bacteroidetes bacterium]|nr:rhodanese-like domain-containing protein [Bacteroidota bacterium]
MKKGIIILSFLASFYLVGCSNSNTSETKTTEALIDSANAEFISPKTDISVDEAFELTKKEALIIDVREQDELAEMAYDVKNVKNIPLGELESRFAEIPKNKQVIVVCKRGGRSSQAYELLKEKGFKNISNMEGGMDAWTEKGLPTLEGGEKKACCANPNNKDCNPDGTCKKPSEKK